LQALDLDSCKIRRIPALAFSGLSGLKELNIRTHNSDWSAMVLVSML
jgi:Leucine-rich repeat (LRR) protein